MNISPPLVPRPASRASSTSTLSAKTPLEVLIRMGFSKKRALKALAATGAASSQKGLQIASDWLMAHANDQTLDEACPRHFHVHLCPAKGSQLAKNLQTFWDASLTQIGWNGAHNSSPHITLIAGLAVPDDKVEELVNIFSRVWNESRGDFENEEFHFEKYVSPNFLGFFVGKNEEFALRNFVQALADEIHEVLGLTIDGAKDKECSFHLTLAYQFSQKHYAGLQDLAASVDMSAKADWEIRLYSCDERMAMPDNNAFKVLRPQKPHNDEELELIQGDFIYISEDSWNSSDNWVFGTSWLTGLTGFLPKNFVTQIAETNTWTVHLAIPLSHVIKDLPSSTSTASLDRLKELATAVTNSTWTLNSSVASETASRSNTIKKRPLRQPRRIFVARHGERVDFTFNSWIQHSFNPESGKYIRRDLNMPKNLPLRSRGREGFARDCPLTVVGSLQANLVGEAMRENNVVINHVYCSPSLRCIQTCHSILEGLGSLELPIHVEPGLFEWLAWYQDAMPDWMTEKELAEAGYNVQLSYKPYISAEELRDSQVQGCVESCEAYYTRNFFVTQCVLAATEEAGGDVLFVGHASTLDACAQQLIGNDPRSMQDLMQVVRKVAYCGVAMLQEEPILAASASKIPASGKRKWSLKEPPFPPLTHCSNARFDVKAFVTE